MTTARQPTPHSTWRIEAHCRNRQYHWQTVRYVGRAVRTFAEYDQALAYVVAHPNGPDREEP